MSAVACQFRSLPNHARFVMGAISESETRDNSVAAGDPSRFKYRVLPYQFVLQDHNYGAPPPPTPPPQSPPPHLEDDPAPDEDTNTSVVTSTTNEEDTVEQSITRCICEFDHDDEYMICCDRCSVWQHVACMGLDRESIPETYLCERCQPRRVDRQKAKTLQNRKRRKLTKCGSEESADGHQYRNHGQGNKTPTSNGNGPGPTAPSTFPGSGRTALKRRRKDKELPVKTFEACAKTVPAVRGSGAPTIRRRKMREKENRKAVPRKKMKRKSVEMNLIDEDARDSWESSLREWIDKYEDAMVNQYSPELLSYMPKLRMNGAREDSIRQTVENLRVQRCRVAEVTKTSKGLVANEDLEENQVICECRGKIQLLSQFRSQTLLGNLRPIPYVMVYSIHKDQESVCVDGRNFGNDSRFIRRSCTPNAEVKHVLDNGNLRLYFASCKKIHKDEEITIPFDTKHEAGEEMVQCACAKEYCATILGTKRNWLAEMSVEGKKRLKRLSATEEDTGSQSDRAEDPQSAVDCKPVVPKTPPGNGVDSTEPVLCPEVPVKGDDDSHAADKKKMTREERKMEAIMKAFARLEKAEQRRQEAMTRMAQKKDDGHQRRRSSGEGSNVVAPLPASGDEKPDGCPPSNPETESIPVDVVPPPPPATDAVSTTLEGNAEVPPVPVSSTQTTVANEVAATAAPPVADVPAVAVQHTQRPRLKGRRRRMSGTPGRRQLRTLSGGSSEVPSGDETSQQMQPLQQVSALQSIVPSIQPPPEPEGEVTSAGTGTVTAMSLSKKLLKTKKHLMNEWLSGESSDVGGSTHANNFNLNLKLEISGVGIGDSCATASPTCYVRCSKSPSGISTAHLRRASVGESNTKCNIPDSSLGSAKKRWLRQAMCEDTEVTAAASAPVANDVASPCQNCSPSTPPLQDLVTPLKKRRLARESEAGTPPSTPPPPQVPPVTTATNSDNSDHVVCDATSAPPPPPPPEQPTSVTDTPVTSTEIVSPEVVVKQESPVVLPCVAQCVTQCVKEEEEEEVYKGAEETVGHKVKEIKVEVEESVDCVEAAVMAAVSQEEEPVTLLSAEVSVKREEEPVVVVAKTDVETENKKEDCGVANVCATVEADANQNGSVKEDTALTETSKTDGEIDGAVDVAERVEDAVAVVAVATVDNASVPPPSMAEYDAESELGGGGGGGGDCSPSSSVPSPVKSPNLTPQTTPTKRKVSLLEYRKRKLEFQSSVPAPVTCPNTALLSDFPSNSPLQLSTLPLFANVTSPEKATDDKGMKGDRLREPQEEVRWGGRPNLLDQQRENLTERLKREFGLVTDDEAVAADAAENEDLVDIPPPPPPLPPPPPPSHPPPMATVYAAARPSTSAKHGFPVFAYVACQVGSQFELPPPPPPPLPLGPMPRAAVQQQQRPPVRTISRPLLPTPSGYLAGQPVVVVEPAANEGPSTRCLDPRPVHGAAARGGTATARYPAMSSTASSSSSSSSSSSVHHQPHQGVQTSPQVTVASAGSNGVPPRHPVQMQAHATTKGYFAPNYFK